MLRLQTRRRLDSSRKAKDELESDTRTGDQVLAEAEKRCTI